MEPFTRADLQLVRASLRAQSKLRELTLLSVAIDSMLRCGDLLSLKVDQVRDHMGGIRDRIVVMQEKTETQVNVTFTTKTRELLAEYIAAAGKWSDDYLFTPEDAPHARHISEVMLRRMVKGWAKIAHRDPSQYSGHSLRRTKAVFVYRETRNAELVRQMLGHSSLAHTIAYLGVKAEEVHEMAKRFDI